MVRLAELRSRFSPWLLLSLAIFGTFVWLDLRVMETLALKAQIPNDGWNFLRWPFVLIFMLRSTAVLCGIGAVAAAPAMVVHLRAPRTHPVVAWLALAAWTYAVAWEAALDWPRLSSLIVRLELPHVVL